MKNTPNFNLPLYEPNDLANLTDGYNNAMSLIDTDMKAVTDHVDTYDTRITANADAIDSVKSMYVKAFKTTDEMLADETLVDGMYVRTAGFNFENDNGGAFYAICKTGTENGMSVLKLKNALFAHLIIEDSVYITQLGAIASESVDISAIVMYAWEHYNDIVFPNGTYFVKGINLNCSGEQHKSIRGEGSVTVLCEDGFVFTGTAGAVYGERINYVTIENIKFSGKTQTFSSRSGTGVVFNWFANCHVKNCEFFYLENGLTFKNGSEGSIYGCVVLGCTNGCLLVKNDENAYTDLAGFCVYNTVMSNCDTVFKLDSVRGVYCNGCTFANSGGKDVVITNTYSRPSNVTFDCCEMENGTNYAAIICEDFECVNVINSKIVIVNENIPGIEVGNGLFLTLTGTIFSEIQQNVIQIDYDCDSNFKLILDSTLPNAPQFVCDKRTTYYSSWLPSKYNRLNFWPDMSRSIIEFATTVAPKWSDNSVSFANNGYIEHTLVNSNNSSVFVVAIIKNPRSDIPVIQALVNGNLVSTNSLNTQTLSDGAKVYVGYVENPSSIRIWVGNNSVIEHIGVYGDNAIAVPKIQCGTMTNVNYIGAPKKGDIVYASSDTYSAPIYVFNGSSFVGIPAS